MIEFDRARRRHADIELTPLIDVVFQLLVFFLLTSTLMAHAIPVDLPRATTGEDTAHTVAVTIDARGLLYVDEVRIERSALRERLRTALRDARAKPSRAVIIADGTTPHARVVEVVDGLRQEGVSQLSFRVQPQAQVSDPSRGPPSAIGTSGHGGARKADP
ncbi:MAG: biopolymer transporter ExbD [Myxococcales bacterium FL481]|nr:MAG: biopolymer transporter ExbD [Myxococcales bacterium FL481]